MLIARIRQRYMIDGVRKFRGTRPAFNGLVEIGRRTTASRSSRICTRRMRSCCAVAFLGSHRF